ncbi:MAG: DUF6783 domain-containing protein [Ruminococcus sp.]
MFEKSFPRACLKSIPAKWGVQIAGMLFQTGSSNIII